MTRRWVYIFQLLHLSVGRLVKGRKKLLCNSVFFFVMGLEVRVKFHPQQASSFLARCFYHVDYCQMWTFRNTTPHVILFYKGKNGMRQTPMPMSYNFFLHILLRRRHCVNIENYIIDTNTSLLYTVLSSSLPHVTNCTNGPFVTHSMRQLYYY